MSCTQILSLFAVLSLTLGPGLARAEEVEDPTEALIEFFSEFSGPDDPEAEPEYAEAAVSGMLIAPVDGRLQVIFPYGGSKAATAGVRPGDVILAIGDDGSFAGWPDAGEAAAAIGAVPVGSAFTITVEREGEKLDIDLVREETAAPGALYPAGKAGDRWGFITASGTMFIPPVYDAAEEFRDGMAHVDFGRGRQGYVNLLGQSLVPDYFNQFQFSDGRAEVATEGQRGYINRSGELVIPLQYESVRWFSESLAAVSEDGETYGYIDRHGYEVIPPEFVDAGDFNEGLAWVQVDPAEDGRYGYIDRTGLFITDSLYEDAGDFSDGLAAVKRNGRYGFIDRDGSQRIPCRFHQVTGFSEGLAAVRPDSGGRWGYIDTTGELVIPVSYTLVGDFSEGLAAVSTDGREFGYIDRTGRMVIPERYGSTSRFTSSLAHVWIGDQPAYIDKTGRTVWKSD